MLEDHRAAPARATTSQPMRRCASQLLSASWAKTRIDGRSSWFAVLPLQTSATGVRPQRASQKDALLAVGQIGTTLPVTVDVATAALTSPASH